MRGKGLVIGETKTAKSKRTIELSAATVAVLKKHRASQAAIRLSAGDAWSDYALVFPTGSGRPWWPHTFLHAFKKVAAASDIDAPDAVTVHCLRHTAATQWIKVGTDIHTVSRRLGHASASFTMDVYGHLLNGMQGTAAEGARPPHRGGFSLVPGSRGPPILGPNWGQWLSRLSVGQLQWGIRRLEALAAGQGFEP